MVKDKRVWNIGEPIYILDGRNFYGSEAYEYLSRRCGFTAEESVEYLAILTHEALIGGSI